MIRHRHSNADGAREAVLLLRGIAVTAAAVLVAWVAAAQSPQAPQPPQTPPPPGAALDAPDQPTTPAPPRPGIPGYQPGFIDAFGRWMQESTAGFNANLNAAWGALPGKGMTDAATDAASNAARNTADAAKGAAEASQGVANAMGSVARDTAGALSRLPAARIAVGRERCGIAPNGAPDCRFAAQALCRAKGYGGGNSVDVETAESCPPDASLARWRGETVTCATENYVTRSLCQ